MKVHNKGQVVIPADVREQLGIEVGDILEVIVIPEEGKIELRRPVRSRAGALGGSLHRYAQGKPFPSDEEIAGTLRRGITKKDG